MENQEFGQKLRELRKQAGLNQRELADKLGVNFTYLSKIESGVMPPPSEKVIQRLAEVLKVDKDELMTLAGRIPADIAQMLKNRETLQSLRAGFPRNSRSANKKEGLSIMKRMKNLRKYNYSRLARVAIAVLLVCAVGASLWFASPLPVKALNISFPSLPTSGTLGSTYTFTVKVDIADAELLPIQSINLYIYKADARATYEATIANLPLATTTTPYTAITATGTSGTAGTVSITATATNWGQFYGYGYASWQGYGYTFFPPTGYGYGYGYSAGGGIASITYTVTWTSPANWPAASYKAETKITANGNIFTQASSAFSLAVPAVEEEAPAAPAPTVVVESPGVYNVSQVVTTAGVFNQNVTAKSGDNKVTVTVNKGTTGKTAEGKAITKVTVTPLAEPPAAPPAGANIIGLVYDIDAGEATFDEPITITLTYDVAAIPAGLSEEDLVLALWDESAGAWVELPSVVDTATNTISAEVTHLSKYAIIARALVPAIPAAFTSSDLSISPAEVDIGRSVTISVIAANTGELTGSYEVTLKIDNVVVETRTVSLAGGVSQKVTFTTTRDAAGTYAVNVDGLSGTFTVKEAEVPARPAAFTTSALSISPTEANVGQAVAISVLVANTGELTGSYEVTLKIGNVAVETRTVSLAGGSSQTVTFTTTRDVEGTYAVTVDTLSGTLTVKVPTVPPAPIAWWVWVIIGVAAVVVIGLLLYFFWWRRRIA